MTATPTPYARQRRYRAKQRADGLCVACFRLYTAENPKTGKPFWKCRWCRLKSSKHYQETGKQL